MAMPIVACAKASGTICAARLNGGFVTTPVRNVKFLDEDNEQMRVLSVDEVKLYLFAASQPLQDIATMMLETGMRPEEVYRIRRENVHLAQGYVFNPYGKTKAAKRKIPLSPTASDVLMKRLDKAKSPYLFPGRIPQGSSQWMQDQSSRSTAPTPRQ